MLLKFGGTTERTIEVRPDDCTVIAGFRLRIVRKGDRYGVNGCLTQSDARPVVEFYDIRSPHTQFGQFVSSYFIATLLQADRWGCGLSLHGGVPEWSISAEDMVTVRSFLRAREVAL